MGRVGQAFLILIKFAGGVLVGACLLAPFGFFSLGWAGNVLTWTDLGPGKVERSMLTGRGADLTQHGVVDLTLRSQGRLVRLRCRGACDDLSEADDAVKSVRALDAAGECVACRRGGWLAPPWSENAAWIADPPAAAIERVTQ